MSLYPTFTYTVEPDKQFGGFNVIQADPPTNRYPGRRAIKHVNSVAEGEQAIRDHLESEKQLREAIIRHGAIGVGSQLVYPIKRNENE